MTEYTIDYEALAAAVSAGTEWAAFDPATSRIKKVNATQTAAFVSANLTGAIIAAGTASVAPLTLAAGTNLTTPAAGAVEFDGTAFYATAVANARQQLDAEQYTIATNDSATYNNTGLDTASAAAVFTLAMGGSANGAITLVAGKTYAFEGQYILTNTGTTSHTWATLFGGTATLTSILYSIFGLSSTSSAPATGGLTGYGTAATAVVATAASTSATENVTIQFNGVLTVNAGGTLIPQMQASARPGASGTPGVVVKKGQLLPHLGNGRHRHARQLVVNPAILQDPRGGPAHAGKFTQPAQGASGLPIIWRDHHGIPQRSQAQRRPQIGALAFDWRLARRGLHLRSVPLPGHATRRGRGRNHHHRGLLRRGNGERGLDQRRPAEHSSLRRGRRTGGHADADREYVRQRRRLHLVHALGRVGLQYPGDLLRRVEGDLKGVHGIACRRRA
jgi:hypothetical protein